MNQLSGFQLPLVLSHCVRVQEALGEPGCGVMFIKLRIALRIVLLRSLVAEIQAKIVITERATRNRVYTYLHAYNVRSNCTVECFSCWESSKSHANKFMLISIAPRHNMYVQCMDHCSDKKSHKAQKKLRPLSSSVH